MFMRPTLNLIIIASFMGSTHFAYAKAPYKDQAVRNGGKIKGEIFWKGPAEQTRTYEINKETDVCGTGFISGPTMKVAANGLLSGAVVYLKKVKKGKAWDHSKLTSDINQKACRFDSKGFVVRGDQKLSVKNSDSVLHNVHGYELYGRLKRSLFNIGQPANSPKAALKLKNKKSPAMKLECDAHNFMHHWLFAANNPYFQITSDDGSFTIDDVPEGSYQLSVWHPAAPSIKHKAIKVVVKKNATVSKKLTLRK